MSKSPLQKPKLKPINIISLVKSGLLKNFQIAVTDLCESIPNGVLSKYNNKCDNNKGGDYNKILSVLLRSFKAFDKEID
jgi:hypothetical protein